MMSLDNPSMIAGSVWNFSRIRQNVLLIVIVVNMVHTKSIDRHFNVSSVI